MEIPQFYHLLTLNMKKVVFLSLIIIFCVLTTFAQQKIKDGTISTGNLPVKDALLELESSNKGFLIARIKLVQTTSPMHQQV
jgi:hypothetical protein